MTSKGALLACLGSIMGLALLLGGCGGGSSEPEDGAESDATVSATEEIASGPVTDVELQLGTFEHVVGESRFGFVLLDQEGKEITEAVVNARFFKVEGTQGRLRTEGEVTFIAIGLEDVAGHEHQEGGGEEELSITGFWVGRPTFDEAGTWGVQAQVELPDGQSFEKEVSFEVTADSTAPVVGEAAPKTRNVLASEVDDIAKVDTANPPDAFHDVRIADAIDAGRPLVVLFVTPEFCTSRTCGPTLEVAQVLASEYEDQVDFVHVEIWEDFQAQKQRPELAEWGLHNEPWVFLVDQDGNIAERFNSLLTLPELEQALEEMLAA